MTRPPDLHADLETLIAAAYVRIEDGLGAIDKAIRSLGSQRDALLNILDRIEAAHKRLAPNDRSGVAS